MARTSSAVAGKNDADRDLAVVGAVGGVEGAAAGVEANFARIRETADAQRPAASPDDIELREGRRLARAILVNLSVGQTWASAWPLLSSEWVLSW